MALEEDIPCRRKHRPNPALWDSSSDDGDENPPVKAELEGGEPRQKKRPPPPANQYLDDEAIESGGEAVEGIGGPNSSCAWSESEEEQEEYESDFIDDSATQASDHGKKRKKTHSVKFEDDLEGRVTYKISRVLDSPDFSQSDTLVADGCSVTRRLEVVRQPDGSVSHITTTSFVPLKPRTVPKPRTHRIYRHLLLNPISKSMRRTQRYLSSLRSHSIGLARALGKNYHLKY